MDNTLKEWVSNLKELSGLFSERQKLEHEIDDGLTKLLKEKNVVKPVKKNLEAAVKPDPPSSSKGIGMICIILSPITFILGLILTIAFDSVFSIISSCCLTVLFLLVGINVVKKNNTYDLEFAKYERIQKSNETKRKWNEEAYPALLKDYEENCIKCSELHKQKCENKLMRIDEINNSINELGDCLHSKYYGDINSIIEIVEEGRADSKKEAINVLIDDKLKLKQHMEQIAHNKAMEEFAEAQTQMQAEVAQMQAAAAYSQARAADAQASAAKAQEERINKLNSNMR